MGYDDASKRMRVDSLHPGVSFEQVQDATGFELLRAPAVGDTPPPRAEELKVLRERIDPLGYVIGRG